MTEAEVLLVSKPLRPPFADGSSVLVRTLVEGMPLDRGFVYFGDPAAPVRSDAPDRVIPRAAMGHAPTLAAKASVLVELLRPRHRQRPLHFFFTPNGVTSRVVGVLRRLSPRRPVIQSVMSAEHAEAFAPFLVDLDAVVVLSDHTRERLLAAGLDAARVHRIHPGVPSVPPELGSPPRRAIYAGDLDLATAGRLVAAARELAAVPGGAWTLVIACRPKGEGDAEARAFLREALAGALADGQVELHGHVDEFEAMLRGCGVQLYLADHVRKKVDLPLAVLEGLARGLGLVALDFRPLDEIFITAEELGLEVGQRLSTPALEEGFGGALRDALGDPERVARWRVEAPRLVEAAFSREALVKAHVSLYERLDVRDG